MLYSFTGGKDGGVPSAALIRDAEGNLYGVTSYGGDLNCNYGDEPGCGVVFKVDTTGRESVLYAFAGRADGEDPSTALVLDDAGNLYGGTFYGGDSSCGCGIVFKLDKSGKETVLHRFGSTSIFDGGGPSGNLIRDSAGALYGTTIAGGAVCNCGTVFEVDRSGKETVLHSFGLSESYPNSLVRDRSGNLYGVSGSAYNSGNVFKLDTKNELTVLYQFTGGLGGGFPNGAYPIGLLQDAAGNLYSTAGSGGDADGDGVVFEVTP